MRLRSSISSASLLLLSLSLVRCVGDDPAVATTDDGGGATDASTNNDAPMMTMDASPIIDSPAGDTFVPPPPAVGTFSWANHFGTTNGGASSVTIDKDGNTIIAVSYAGTFAIALGDGGVTTVPVFGGGDVAIIKMDPLGKPIWATSFGGTSNEIASSVTTDANGDIYIAGATVGTFAFGSTPTIGIATKTVGFITKLNANGTQAWGRMFGNASVTSSNCQTITARAEVIVAGCTFGGSITYVTSAGSTNLNAIGTHDMLVVQVAPADGTTTWALPIGNTAGSDNVTGVAIDETTDNVWVSGNFSPANALQGLGTAPTPVGTGVNLLVAKLLTANGSPQYSKAYGDAVGNTDVKSAGIAVGNGVVAMSGTYGGPGVDLGAGSLGPGTMLDAFVFAISASTKSTLFQQSIGGSLDDFAGGVAVDQYGRVSVVGTYYSSGVSIGGGALPNPTASSAEGTFVAKFDSMGTKLWVKGIVGIHPGDAIDGNAMAIGPNAQVTAAGLLQGSADFGSGTAFNSLGDLSDAFVVTWAE